MKKITIIGSGISALSASCYLAKENFDVTVVEKNDYIGGRLSQFNKDGFKFDKGPSWYWMPEVFESFFNDFDRKTSDYYKLKRITPSYKLFHEKNNYNIPSDINSVYNLFESLEKGSSKKLKYFLKQARRKYNISIKHFMYQPNNSILEYFSLSYLKYLFTLDMFKSLRSHISSFFNNKILKDLLEFPSMFLGGSPNNTPALYSLMNYADIIKGTWYPMGGMYEITKGFKKLSEELGVKYIKSEEIDSFKIENDKIHLALSKTNKKFISDAYLTSAEYPFVQMNLISKKYRTYDNNYWDKLKVAPSSLLFYLGLNKKVDNLEHHNLFFDKDFDEHLNDIFDKKIWPSRPLFYVCCPSKSDESVVPDKNYENLFILVPIGPDSNDSKDIREKYFSMIIERIESKIKDSIKNNIIFKKSYCVKDFKHDYNSYKGNAYGLANTLFQTAVFKPKMKDKKIKNLYYSGHFTVPGPGLPPGVISGKIAAKQIIKDMI